MSYYDGLRSLIDQMAYGYRVCAVWSSMDDDGSPLDDTFGEDDFTREARAEILSQLTDFVAGSYDDVRAVMDSFDGSPEGIGHDFWLTRNHHGAGFWDRGYGPVGDRLTSAAHSWGDAYVTPEGCVLHHDG